MSEYMFLSGPGHLPRKADKIAARHGAGLVNYTNPGCACGWNCGERGGCKANRLHWFVGPNRGYPFDARMSRDVEADLISAGVLKAKVRS